MGANIKSMTYEQVRSYQKELKAQGKTASNSKEYGKTENYIKTLKPENYGKETVASAYNQLSSGVKYTGGWTEKNLGAIEKYTGKKPSLVAPTSTEQLPKYLSDYQDSVFNASSSPELRDSIVNQLEPDMAKPEPINRVEQFETMRKDMGVADLETSLTDLKAQLETEYATKRTRTRGIEGKPVAMGVIAGRVSEVERQETERIDAIGRQINVISDQLNTSYNVISQYMNFMGLDYQDSVTAYNAEFNKNLQIYQLVDAEMDEATAAARANLQIYQNAVTAGNISYDKLSSTQRTFINKLEMQSGLPIGFTASLRADNAGGKVLSTTTRESGNTKYADIVMQMPDGSMQVKTQTLGNSSSGTGDGYTTKTSDKYLKDAQAILERQDIAVTGNFPSASKFGETQGKDSADTHLSYKEMDAARNQIIALVGDETEGRALFNRAMNAGGYSIWGQ